MNATAATANGNGDRREDEETEEKDEDGCDTDDDVIFVLESNDSNKPAAAAAAAAATPPLILPRHSMHLFRTAPGAWCHVESGAAAASSSPRVCARNSASHTGRVRNRNGTRDSMGSCAILVG
uniref:Uncharacterized protein n=1 Tax=Mantoniella antarctica TaxID=81844 RepID=A0A7S0SKP3_9CHLO